jgi:hypothetical protein
MDGRRICNKMFGLIVLQQLIFKFYKYSNTNTVGRYNVAVGVDCIAG